MAMFRNTKVELHSSFYIILATSILLLPIQWVFGWFIAAATHEMGHIVSMALLNVRIYSIQFNILGAKIEAENMYPANELISSLAGPVAALIFVIFYRSLPHIAICAAIQSLFNLLPIYPMDGGRVLHCACMIITNEHIADIVIKFTGVITTLTICVAIISVGWKYFGAFSLLPCIIISFKYLAGKYPCKVKKQIVE